jgi:hypothetical protein
MSSSLLLSFTFVDAFGAERRPRLAGLAFDLGFALPPEADPPLAEDLGLDLSGAFGFALDFTSAFGFSEVLDLERLPIR